MAASYYAVADPVRRAAGRLPPIRPLRRYEFDAIARREPYYRGRWTYMSVACELAGDLITRHRLRSAIELGPHKHPVIVGADVMDLRPRADLRRRARVIVADARQTPWPMGDQGCDLFVALQVFEHLADRQREAFGEVRRVARHAIISLPIDWDLPDPRDPHHQISHERALSWFAPIVPTRVELGNGGPRKRLIYVFENLDAAPPVGSPPVGATEPEPSVRPA